VTGTYDPATNQTLWGTGNPVPMFDPFYRPGDNLYTNSVISWDPDNGKMNWYFQFTLGDMWDFDEVGTHILIERMVNGQPRKLVTHSALLHHGAGERRHGRRQALHGGQLDAGHRPEDRQARRSWINPESKTQICESGGLWPTNLDFSNISVHRGRESEKDVVLFTRARRSGCPTGRRCTKNSSVAA
jgi:hypothetical protein